MDIFVHREQVCKGAFTSVSLDELRCGLVWTDPFEIGVVSRVGAVLPSMLMVPEWVVGSVLRGSSSGCVGGVSIGEVSVFPRRSVALGGVGPVVEGMEIGSVSERLDLPVVVGSIGGVVCEASVRGLGCGVSVYAGGRGTAMVFDVEEQSFVAVGTGRLLGVRVAFPVVFDAVVGLSGVERVVSEKVVLKQDGFMASPVGVLGVFSPVEHSVDASVQVLGCWSLGGIVDGLPSASAVGVGMNVDGAVPLWSFDAGCVVSSGSLGLGSGEVSDMFFDVQQGEIGVSGCVDISGGVQVAGCGVSVYPDVRPVAGGRVAEVFEVGACVGDVSDLRLSGIGVVSDSVVGDVVDLGLFDVSERLSLASLGVGPNFVNDGVSVLSGGAKKTDRVISSGLSLGDFVGS